MINIHDLTETELIALCLLHGISPDQEYKKLKVLGAAVDYLEETELIAQLVEVRFNENNSPALGDLARVAMLKYYGVATHALRCGGILEPATVRAVYPTLRQLADRLSVQYMERQLANKENDVLQLHAAIKKREMIGAMLEDFEAKRRAAVEKMR